MPLTRSATQANVPMCTVGGAQAAPRTQSAKAIVDMPATRAGAAEHHSLPRYSRASGRMRARWQVLGLLAVMRGTGNRRAQQAAPHGAAAEAHLGAPRAAATPCSARSATRSCAAPGRRGTRVSCSGSRLRSCQRRSRGRCPRQGGRRQCQAAQSCHRRAPAPPAGSACYAWCLKTSAGTASFTILCRLYGSRARMVARAASAEVHSKQTKRCSACPFAPAS